MNQLNPRFNASLRLIETINIDLYSQLGDVSVGKARGYLETKLLHFHMQNSSCPFAFFAKENLRLLRGVAYGSDYKRCTLLTANDGPKTLFLLSNIRLTPRNKTSFLEETIATLETISKLEQFAEHQLVLRVRSKTEMATALTILSRSRDLPEFARERLRVTFGMATEFRELLVPVEA